MGSAGPVRFKATRPCRILDRHFASTFPLLLCKTQIPTSFFPSFKKITRNELFIGSTCTDGGLISWSLSARAFQPNPIPIGSLGEIVITQRLQQGQNSEWILKSCRQSSNCPGQGRRPDCAEGAWQALATLRDPGPLRLLHSSCFCF